MTPRCGNLVAGPHTDRRLVIGWRMTEGATFRLCHRRHAASSRPMAPSTARLTVVGVSLGGRACYALTSLAGMTAPLSSDLRLRGRAGPGQDPSGST
jgi:hypothetical protein